MFLIFFFFYKFIKIQDLKSVFSKISVLELLYSNYILQSLERLCTPGFGHFIPFFLADPLRFCQNGWAASVNCHLQVFPKLQYGLSLVHSRTVRDVFKSQNLCILLVIVTSLPQFQVACILVYSAMKASVLWK